MGKNKTLLLKLIVSIISVGVFWWLESGFSLRNGDELIKSVIFAVSLFIILTKKFRVFVLWFSIFLLTLMIILYLFWQITLATLFGSIGFGIFLIYILSYLPDLIKRGFVEEK